MVTRVAALVLTLGATAALGQSSSVDGVGRISVTGGYRYLDNSYFAGRALDVGTPVTAPSPGGPALVGSFGYGATSSIEAVVELFGAYETFSLLGLESFVSTSYGALIGVRLTQLNVLVPGLQPYLGIGAGPTVALVTSPFRVGRERLLIALAGSAGLSYRVAPGWAVSLDVRYLHARLFVEGISGINVGGLMASLGVTFYVPAAPKRDLLVPGF